jgi:hypothetical protein
VLSSFGPGGPSIVGHRGDRWHRFGSPGGSLRDQVLASLKPAFGRDRNQGGRCGVATEAEAVLSGFSPPSGLAALHRREKPAIAGIAPARLAARCAIRFSLRSNLPSDAIATGEALRGCYRG